MTRGDVGHVAGRSSQRQISISRRGPPASSTASAASERTARNGQNHHSPSPLARRGEKEIAWPARGHIGEPPHTRPCGLRPRPTPSPSRLISTARNPPEPCKNPELRHSRGQRAATSATPSARLAPRAPMATRHKIPRDKDPIAPSSYLNAARSGFTPQLQRPPAPPTVLLSASAHPKQS